ncbi:hypothetical protein HOI26_03970, partial [Candidatus Woesearchaeota archaeon]|nr:hypothetical protein [Candidatus Woesearchaeota archaeon]
MVSVNIKKFSTIFLIIVFLLSLAPLVQAEDQGEYHTAVIFYNEACSMCSMYIKQELIPTLEEAGIKEIIKKDYINEKKNRVVLNELNKRLNIPPKLQGHFTVFIDNKVVLGGHVPKHVVMDLLTKDLEYDRILVLQDEMKNAKSYFAWGFKGDAKEYTIDSSITGYLNWFTENEDSLTKPENSYSSSWKFSTMLPLIVSSGFLDGINPCAFAVL